MLLYLEHAYEKWRAEGRMRSIADLHEAIIEGAVKRIRPKVMTIMAILMGLLPIMWSHGAGADVMKRIAAPMIGGVITSFLLELARVPRNLRSLERVEDAASNSAAMKSKA